MKGCRPWPCWVAIRWAVLTLHEKIVTNPHNFHLLAWFTDFFLDCVHHWFFPLRTIRPIHVMIQVATSQASHPQLQTTTYTNSLHIIFLLASISLWKCDVIHYQQESWGKQFYKWAKYRLFLISTRDVTYVLERSSARHILQNCATISNPTSESIDLDQYPTQDPQP